MDYKPGTKCFAKVKGYSPWPARIDVLPDDVKIPRGKYPIFFYGTHEVSYVTAKDIFDFDKYRPIYGLFKEKNTKFNDGIREIEDNPTIYQLGIDKNAVEFLSQFYKFDLDKITGGIPSDIRTFTVKELKTPIKSPTRSYRKRQHISIDTKEHTEPVPKTIKLDDSPLVKEGTVNIDPAYELIKLEDPSIIEPKDSTLSPEKKQQLIEVPAENTDSTLSPEKKQQLIEVPAENTESSTENVPSQADESKIENLMKQGNLEVSIILQDVLSDIPSLRRVPDNHPRDSENNNIIKNKDEVSSLCNSKNLDDVLNSFKSPTKATNNERPKRASAVKFKQNFMSYLKALSSNQKFSSKKPDLLLRLKKDNDRIKKLERKSISLEEKIKIKSETRKHSLDEHKVFVDYNQNQSVRLKLSESNEKKEIVSEPVTDSTDTNLRIISKLSIIDKEIKRSLIVGQENSDKCRTMMNSLLELDNLTLVLLCQVPEIVVTIRKCRRYKKDDSIKAQACQIFQKFLQIYEVAELEEKIEAGTELLKRDSEHCKSAQVLLDELFVVDRNQATVRQKLQPSLVLSSPSSAQSLHSSANNTPLLSNNDPGIDDVTEQSANITVTETVTPTTEPNPILDPDIMDINKLIRDGVLELIESYCCDDPKDLSAGTDGIRLTGKSATTTVSTPVANNGAARNHRHHQQREFMFLIDDVELYKQLGV